MILRCGRCRGRRRLCRSLWGSRNGYGLWDGESASSQRANAVRPNGPGSDRDIWWVRPLARLRWTGVGGGSPPHPAVITVGLSGYSGLPALCCAIGTRIAACADIVARDASRARARVAHRQPVGPVGGDGREMPAALSSCAAVILGQCDDHGFILAGCGPTANLSWRSTPCVAANGAVTATTTSNGSST